LALPSKENDMKTAPALLALALLTVAPFAQTDAAFAGPKGCPPGLAKKNPPCVPPGQVNKGATTKQWVGRTHIGDVADRDDLIFIDDYTHYELPPLPYGQRYALVDNQIIVVDTETYAILQLIQTFSALAD
jgi:hypothetical protein